MKKIILVSVSFVIFTFTALAQETNVVAKRKGLLAPYFSVYQTFEGLTFMGGGKEPITGFLSSTFLELTLGKRFFFSLPIGASIIPIGTMAGWSYGLGVGYNILDNRDENFKGDLFRASILWAGKSFFNSKNTDELGKAFWLLGGQINLTYQRNFDENFALRVGFIFGLYAKEDYYPLAVNYGLSIGLAF